jgi:hypothetical protein
VEQKVEEEEEEEEEEEVEGEGRDACAGRGIFKGRQCPSIDGILFYRRFDRVGGLPSLGVRN